MIKEHKLNYMGHKIMKEHVLEKKGTHERKKKRKVGHIFLDGWSKRRKKYRRTNYFK
jgi:hypothetical protein